MDILKNKGKADRFVRTVQEKKHAHPKKSLREKDFSLLPPGAARRSGSNTKSIQAVKNGLSHPRPLLAHRPYKNRPKGGTYKKQKKGRKRYAPKSPYLKYLWFRERRKRVYRKTRKVFKSNNRRVLRHRRKMYKWTTRVLTKLYFKLFLRHFKSAKVYIVSTYRNMIVTITTSSGKVLHRVSSGSAKGAAFKKSLRKKPYPATSVGKEAALWLKKNKVRKVIIFMKGVGRGKNRRFVLKSLEKKRILILAIKELTAIPHNGCRRPKKRRL